LWQLLRELREAFHFAVDQQINGQPLIDELEQRAGQYDSRPRLALDGGWHPDGGQRILRYVVAFGSAKPTEFALGRISSQDIDVDSPRDDLTIQRGQRLQPHAFGSGKIVRFVSDYYLHRAGQGSGSRVFCTASVKGLIPA